MVKVTFTCDYCGRSDHYGGLRHGYVMPKFRDKDMCRECRYQAQKILSLGYTISSDDGSPDGDHYVLSRKLEDGTILVVDTIYVRDNAKRDNGT